jgi:hypothetical protein
MLLLRSRQKTGLFSCLKVEIYERPNICFSSSSNSTSEEEISPQLEPGSERKNAFRAKPKY